MITYSYLRVGNSQGCVSQTMTRDSVQLNFSWNLCLTVVIMSFLYTARCMLAMHFLYYLPHSFICNCLFIYLFFWCGPFLKSLLNLLQYCFCFIFWSLGRKACGILAPRPGIEPAPLALEGEVLTTGLPGKSLSVIVDNKIINLRKI